MLKIISMEQKESFERFDESMKKAASRCRELGAMIKDKNWHNIGKQLDALAHNGVKIYKSKAIGRQELLKTIDRYNAKEAEKIQ